MASRKNDKAQARAERIAREQAEAAARARRERLSAIGGVIVIVVVIALVAVAVLSHHGKPTNPNNAINRQTAAAKAVVARVDALLAGIPQQSDNVLGRASAPVSVIEYGDLECSVCDALALSNKVDDSDGSSGSGVEDQVIQQLVKAGKVKLIYRSLETATAKSPNASEWKLQQSAVYAAGLQEKGWNYLELFYNEQGEEGSNYVDNAFLDGIAKQISGLDYSRWLSDLNSAKLRTQVTNENGRGTAIDTKQAGGVATPTVLVQGPKGQRFVAVGIPSYSQITAAIKAVQ